MRGRGIGAKKRNRLRINVELSPELSDLLEAYLSTHRLSKSKWLNGVISAALRKKGTRAVFGTALIEELRSDQRRLIDEMFFVLTRMNSEPFLFHPTSPLTDHVRAILGSAIIAEIRQNLEAVMRHVAAMKHVANSASKQPTDKNRSNMSQAEEQKDSAI